MTVPVRLAAFAVVLGTAFGGGLALGALVDPAVPGEQRAPAPPVDEGHGHVG